MSEQARQKPGILRRYIFSLDHKVIGIQYFCLALVAALTGVLLSLLMRLRIAWPTAKWPLLESIFPTGFQGGQMQPEFYLAMVTMHGTIMVFMVLTTAPQGAFGNYFLPIQIGAADMAFPVLNMLSFWTTFLSFVVLMLAFFVEGGGTDCGLDLLSTIELDPKRGAWAIAWRRPLADQYWHLLRGISFWSSQFHYDDAQHAGRGHDTCPNATDVLGVADDGHDLAARISGAPRSGNLAAC
jgi:hypothetical protein